MSERSREFFEAIKDGKSGQDAKPMGLIEAVKEAMVAIAPGLKDLVPEAKAELGRLGTQGQMELANCLFNGSAFVPYGPGQYTPSPEHDAGVHGQDAKQAEQQQPQQEMQQERGGRGC
jgi:hypothetical protein